MRPPAPVAESFPPPADDASPVAQGGSPSTRSLIELLHELVRADGSDLHCKVGSPPRIRVDGKLRCVDDGVLTTECTARFVGESLPNHLHGSLEASGDADYAFAVNGLGRFRVNAYRARGSYGLAIRRVPVGARPLEDLGLPKIVESLTMEPRGIVLVTGPTGSGKTTTLASMVDLINRHRECHIVTVEDPIEVLHPDKRSMVSQREIGLDTGGFSAAVRAAMRQDPDVILVGEMRDLDTVRAAMTAAMTGHLVLSTLHTNDVGQSVARIVDMFPEHEQKQARLSLAGSLRGVVSQRLAPRLAERGRCLVVEACVNSQRVAEAIADPALTEGIADIIREDEFHGMQTFDQHLLELVRRQAVGARDAMHIATNPEDLVLEMRRQGLVA